LSDEALMFQLQQGQHNALAVLFDRYHRLVTTIASRILRDVGEAEDLMQAVFLEIFRSSAQFDPAKGSTRVWLLQYAYHRSFNRRHYLSLRGLYEYPSREEDEPDLVPTRNAESYSAMESSHLVKEALGSLNGAQRKVLELAFYEGLTMREIAEKTSYPASNASAVQARVEVNVVNLLSSFVRSNLRARNSPSLLFKTLLWSLLV
jgi:RNA polymerase sigma-70 factor, ECF subfamily